jgi:hypothetical protein
MASRAGCDESAEAGVRERLQRQPHHLRSRSWEVRAQATIDSLRSMAVEAARARDEAVQEPPPPDADPDGGGPGRRLRRRKAARPAAPPDPTDSTSFCVRYHHVLMQLREAESYLDLRSGLKTWWRGTRIEGAWGHIHTATVGMIAIATTDQLLALAPRLLGVVEAYLDPEDPERRAIQSWFDQLPRPVTPPLVEGAAPTPGAATSRSAVAAKGKVRAARGAAPAASTAPGVITAQSRGALEGALSTTYARIGAEYQRLRRFQWTITGSAVVILVLVAVLGGIGWRYPGVVPLCFPDPDAATTTTVATTTTTAPATTTTTTAAGAGDDAAGDDAADEAADQATAATTTTVAPAEPTAEPPVCPSHDRPAAVSGGEEGAGDDEDGDEDDDDSPSTPGDVATVLLFGLVGASLTSVPFVARRSPPTSVPVSSIRVAQAVLKAAVGMLSAVVGLLLLRAGAVPGFTQIDTRSQVLGYAIVFGAAQQLVTRIIDDRSNTLIGTVTADDSDSAATP